MKGVNTGILIVKLWILHTKVRGFDDMFEVSSCQIIFSDVQLRLRQGSWKAASWPGCVHIVGQLGPENLFFHRKSMGHLWKSNENSTEIYSMFPKIQRWGMRGYSLVKYVKQVVSVPGRSWKFGMWPRHIRRKFCGVWLEMDWVVGIAGVTSKIWEEPANCLIMWFHWCGRACSHDSFCFPCFPCCSQKHPEGSGLKYQNFRQRHPQTTWALTSGGSTPNAAQLMAAEWYWGA